MPFAWDETIDLEEGTPADFDSIVPAWTHTVLEEEAEFDSVTDADNDLNAAVGAVKLGTKGFEVTFDDANAAYGTINATAVNRTQGTFDFWFNPHAFSLQSGTDLWPLVCIDDVSNWTIFLHLNRTGDVFSLRLGIYNDGGGYNYTDAIDIASNDWSHIRVVSKRSSALGADDGFAHLYIDDGTTITHESVTGIDNDTRDWDNAFIGVFFTTSTTFGGSFYFDEVRVSENVSPAWVTPAAALEGDYGIAWTIEDETQRYGLIDGPDAETQMTIEFRFDPNGLSLAAGKAVDLLYSDDHDFYFQLYDAGAGDKLYLYVREDDDGFVSNSIAISDEPHTLRILWKASSAPGADDGWGALYVDDVLAFTITGVDNDTRTINTLYVGVDPNTDAITGIIFIDNIRWSDEICFVQDATGGLAGSGSMLKEIGKAAAGGLSGSGVISKAINVASGYAGALGLGGTVNKLMDLNRTHVDGNLTMSGSIAKATSKVIVGTLALVGGLNLTYRFLRAFIEAIGDPEADIELPSPGDRS